MESALCYTFNCVTFIVLLNQPRRALLQIRPGLKVILSTRKSVRSLRSIRGHLVSPFLLGKEI